ncbi:MAG: T9SS type A sorting domain-containing protein [Bacteroidetes bacterium]|nr:T9SS type A sorting domain-containing protein [Bacteroidota bacterium]
MNKQNKNEISQIKEHIKVLNITGGIAITALAVAGYLMLTNNPSPEQPIVQEVRVEASAAATSVYDVPASADQVSNLLSENRIEESAKPSIEEAPEQAAKQTQPEEKESDADMMERALSSKTIAEELHSFEASCDNGSILFNWVTEGGSKYAYEVEKTYDKVHYEVFSRAPQPQKKEGKNFYSIEEATEKDETAYYRLRKVIGKGRYEYSDPVQVKCESAMSANTEVDVFPNGYGSFRILINTSADSQFNVSLSDVDDNELVTDNFDAKAGSNEFVISSSSIAKGNYVLRVTNGSMIKEKRVVLK